MSYSSTVLTAVARLARARELTLGVAALAAAALIGLSPSTIFAQSADLDVTWSMEDIDLTVGDPFFLTISADYPKGYHAVFPDLPEDWEGFEVRSQTPLPTVSNPDGTLTTGEMYEMVLFRPGEHPTPEVLVTFRQPDGQIVQRPVPPITVQVNSVLQDGDEELRDIKPQAEIPVPSLWPWGLGGIATLALLIAGAVLLRRRLSRPACLPVGPVDLRTPFEIAMDQLDRVESLDLPSRGRFKEHFTLVADAIREYLSGEYGVPAPDQTTAETSLALRGSSVSTAACLDILVVLQTCDIVKFTELVPTAETSREAVHMARAAIETMRPAPAAAQSTALKPAEAASG